MNLNIARQTLGDLLRRSRLRFPNKLAIRCGSIDWTYAEFDDVCNQLVTGLADRGIEIGDRVAVIARNSTPLQHCAFRWPDSVLCWSRSTSC